MERRTDIIRAKEIMGSNLIDPEKLFMKSKELGIFVDNKLIENPPEIPFPENILNQCSKDYLLFFGARYKDGSPLTILKMREHFGTDPDIKEPCFYNQDWYLNERFAKYEFIHNKWYLIRKIAFDKCRGMPPHIIKEQLGQNMFLPLAVVATFAFFINYHFNNGEILWKHDYIWCADRDHKGDQIYVGRYIDPAGINRNGFNIHRYLTIDNRYSYVDIRME